MLLGQTVLLDLIRKKENKIQILVDRKGLIGKKGKELEEEVNSPNTEQNSQDLLAKIIHQTHNNIVILRMWLTVGRLPEVISIQ